MPGKELRLLALDGGGVRGLSSLMILEQLMWTINPENPPKPCEYFDMIGGTSTGGLIAVMLGRLEMTIDECIESYLSLSDQIFQKKAHRVTIQGKIQGRFDSHKLEQAVKEVVRQSKLPEDTLLKSVGDAKCKVFVCATSKETSETVCLTSYKSPRGNDDLLNSTKIWEACQATSAASSFFDPIAIGRYGEEFVDGATGANNPVWEVWNQAQAIYGPKPLEDHLDCLVSIGTGVPPLKAFRDDVLHIHETLIAMATETEQTAERFRRNKAHVDEVGRYYRFNVSRGLEEIGLEESKKKKEIAAATRRYVTSQEVFKQMKACADRVSRKQFPGKYYIPFSLRGIPVIDKFVDRAVDIAELNTALIPHRRSHRRQVFVLSGVGGVGKTQLAAEFSRRNHGRYSAVFWLDGSSEDSLKQSMAYAATRIPTGQIPEAVRTFSTSEGVDLDLIVEHVLGWLSRADNSCWLVVIDNVDREYRAQGTQPGAYDIARYLPWADHGSILVTTRLGELGQYGTAARKLQKVDDDLAKAIFCRWYSRKFDDDQGSSLLKLLDGLPLALTQAAAYMQQTGTSFSQYINLYNSQWRDLMQSHETDGLTLPKYNGSIWTTWVISFEAIRAKNKGAADLLLFWALIDNRDLWYGLFEEIRKYSMNKSTTTWTPLQEAYSSELRFNNAMRLLLNYSLVEEMEHLGGYVVHPVVHRWARHMQNEERQVESARLAVMVIGLAIPSRFTRDFWTIQRRLMGHADNCFEWVVSDLIQISRAPDCDSDDELVYNSHLDDILSALLGLGYLYRNQGKLDKAGEMYQRALRGQEQALGTKHMSTLNTVNNLGNLYANQGKLDKAEEMYQRALRGYEQALGTKHTSTLRTVNNLGALYVDQGKLKKAEAMYQRALRGQEQTLGAEHTSTLNTVNNLGNLYMNQGKLDKAEEMYRWALRGYEYTLVAEHTSILRTVNNLGALYANQGKLNKAEEMYKRALRGFEQTMGVEHTSTLNTVNNLGALYKNQGKLDKAEKMYERALRGYEQAIGAEHTSTLRTVNNLGALYRNQGKLDKAEEMYKRMLRGYEQTMGLEHTSTLDMVNNLGNFYKNQGKLEKAEDMYKQALRGYSG